MNGRLHLGHTFTISKVHVHVHICSSTVYCISESLHLFLHVSTITSSLDRPRYVNKNLSLSNTFCRAVGYSLCACMRISHVSLLLAMRG